MKKILLMISTVLFFFILFNEEIFSIPAFARKYNMTCQTCHSPFPKLKPYGDDFAANGFQLKDKESPRYFIETGDDELSLLREIPLALRLEGYASYNSSNSERTDFSTPYLLKILSGGSIAKDISYYFYFFFSEKGEVSGIEDAYVMFNNLFGSELDVFVGQFQISDPLFKNELRLSFEEYKPYKLKVGLSNINLSYDRGLMLSYNLPTNTDLVFELTNGNGIGGQNQYSIFDGDKYKNLFFRASQDIIKSVRVGGFVEYGKESIENVIQFDNEVFYWGGDLTLKLNDKLELNGQYLQRNDNNPIGIDYEVTTDAAFVELIFTPKGDASKWYALGLFNWIESDLSEHNYRTGTFHLGYLLRRNFRLTSEFTYNLKDDFATVSLGFVSAF
ncbi:MAG: hypothetical protein STSR0008_09150 [Ignavibacterium sp.]